ncbi:MAG TPA: hypothetical protein VLN59_02900, partial [Burkholderiales bacterium]|nr:hypothetical protein [Burkholderiales bacterium]
RLDESSKSSEMGVEITFATLNAMMAGAVGEKSGQMQMLQTALGKQRNSIETNVRNNIAVTLAFLYRKASDADLASYAELLETADLKLFRDVVYESLITEIKAASKEFGERVGALLKPTGPGSAPPSGIPVRDTGAPRVMRTSSRANLDARICLQRTSNIEIIQCAEEYR